MLFIIIDKQSAYSKPEQRRRERKFVMRVQWTKKDVPLTPAMKDRVDYRAENFQGKFPDEDFHLMIGLTQNKGRKKPHSYRLKGILRNNGMTISAESREMDFYDAVDVMMDTLLSNYRREIEKRKRQERQSRRELKEFFKPTTEVDEYEDYEYLPED